MGSDRETWQFDLNQKQLLKKNSENTS